MANNRISREFIMKFPAQIKQRKTLVIAISVFLWGWNVMAIGQIFEFIYLQLPFTGMEKNQTRNLRGQCHNRKGSIV